MKKYYKYMWIFGILGIFGAIIIAPKILLAGVIAIGGCCYFIKMSLSKELCSVSE